MANPKKPTNLRILAGNPSGRKIPKEPKSDNIQKTVPRTLSKGGKAYWRSITAAMPAGVFQQTDLAILEAYCEAVASHREAVKMIEKEGSVSLGSQGQPIISPWVRIRNEASGKIVTLGSKLGLSPVDRTNLQAPPEEHQNPFLS